MMNYILCEQLIKGFETLKIRQKEDILEHWEKTSKFSLEERPLLDLENGAYKIGQGYWYPLVCPQLLEDIKGVIFSYLCRATNMVGENIKIQPHRPEFNFYSVPDKYRNAITKMHGKRLENKKYPVYLITINTNFPEQYDFPVFCRQFHNTQDIEEYFLEWLKDKTVTNDEIQFFKAVPEFGFIKGNSYIPNNKKGFYFTFKKNKMPFDLTTLSAFRFMISDQEWHNLGLYVNRFSKIIIHSNNHKLSWSFGSDDTVIFDVPHVRNRVNLVTRRVKPQIARDYGGTFRGIVGPRRLITPFSNHYIDNGTRGITTGRVRSNGRSWEFELMRFSESSVISFPFAPSTAFWVRQCAFVVNASTVFIVPKFRMMRCDDGIQQHDIYDNFFLPQRR